MSRKSKLQRELWLMGLFKVPMIFYCRPRVDDISDDSVRIRIKSRRRTRNHLNSVYIGVFTVGADIAGGILAFDKVRYRNLKASILFKSLSAQYYKRAESDVIFECREGLLIDQMIDKSLETKERQNQKVSIDVFSNNEKVAEMVIELSLKVK